MQSLYGANNIAPRLDNMDQRVCEDLRLFTYFMGSIFFGGDLSAVGCALCVCVCVCVCVCGCGGRCLTSCCGNSQ